MGPRTQSFLQLLSLAFLAWFACRLLAQWHAGLVLLLVLFGAGNVAAAWIIRYQPQWLRALKAKPGVRQYLRCVCWCMGKPFPHPDEPAGEGLDQRLLRTAHDFQVAAQRAKEIVRGHDEVIDRLLGRVQENILLRSRRKSHPPQPLASFLLVGSGGIGKRYLTRVLSKLLYRHPGTLVFECERLTAETLVGTADRAGELLQAVCSQPSQLVLFDHVDSASEDVIRILSTILTRGEFPAPDTKQPVSFAEATLVMTTASGLTALSDLNAQSLPEAAWHARSVEMLMQESTLDSECLNALAEIVLCQRPSDAVNAEVVVLLMKKEAAAHGVHLARIDPEIVASQVLQITDEHGFALAPERVKKLLRKPLLAAHQHDQKTLSLRVRPPEPVPAGVFS